MVNEGLAGSSKGASRVIDHTIKTKVYITEGQTESLLFKDDGIALGILNINPDGRMPDEKVRCITPETLNDTIKNGVVSDGQTQPQIDAVMKEITEEHKAVFQGMGRAKVPPIHIQLKEDARPITQPKRRIPIQLRDATLKKLKELKDNDLIEGPLPPHECKGWLTNMVVTKKSGTRTRSGSTLTRKG